MTPSVTDPTTARTHPAASMLLLETLLRDVELDYGPGRTPPPAPGAVRRVVLLLTAVALGFVLSVAVVTRQSESASQAQARAALVGRVQQQTDELAALQAAVADARRHLTEVEQAALARTTSGAALASRLAQLEAAAGLTAVSGPGVRLVLNDATPDPVQETIPEGGRVLDQDLQMVTNGLWQAGAEAIAVNGHRLTATSAIRAAGEAILVDLRPLAPPYTVEAVGDAAGLRSRFAESPAASELRSLTQDYGLRWHLDQSDDLELPAAQQR